MGNITNKIADKWFWLHDIPTSLVNGRFKVCDGSFDFELSDEEIRYRADLYIQYLRKEKQSKINFEQDDFYKMVNELVDIASMITDKYKKK